MADRQVGGRERRPRSRARRARPRSSSSSISTAAGSTRSTTGIAVLRPHARVVREARRLRSALAREGRSRRSTCTTRSRTSASRSARRCARRSATRAGIRRYGFRCCRWRRRSVEVSLDVSNRAYLVYRVELANDRVARLRRLAGRGLPVRVLPERRHRSARGAALRQESPPRGRGDLQGPGARAARRGGARSRAIRGRASVKGSCSLSRLRPRIALVDYGAGNLRRSRRRSSARGSSRRRHERPVRAARAPTPWCCPASAPFATRGRACAAKGLDEAVLRGDRRGPPLPRALPRPPAALRGEPTSTA